MTAAVSVRGLTKRFGQQVAVVALTVTLVWLFVVETAVVAFVPRVGRWLLFHALNAVFMSDEAAAAMGPTGPQLLPPLVGLSVFIGCVVVSARHRHRADAHA